MDIPEGMMLITDHQQAMAELRAELGQAANQQQEQINALTHQVQGLQLQEGLSDQVATLTKQLADMTAERDTANRDNANLKAKMMSYLADSDSGKSLLLGLELMQVDALLTALNAKKAEIEKVLGS